MRLDKGQLRLAASDVANFVACGHLTRLDLLHARGEIQPPHAFDVGFQDLVARGEAHEAAVLAAVPRRRLARRGDPRRAAGRRRAGHAGSHPRRCRRRVPGRARWRISRRMGRSCSGGRTSWSGPGCCPRRTGNRARPGGHYEVLDAKLARSAKARAVAQVGFYSDLLAGVQGIRPRWMHLALGDGEFTLAEGRRLRRRTSGRPGGG